MSQKPPAATSIAATLQHQDVKWLQAEPTGRIAADSELPTQQVLDRYEMLWGKTPQSQAFREKFTQRGLTLYNYRLEDHFTGSAIVLDPKTRTILMTLHPWYKLWLQLGGHDEVKQPTYNPLAISALEAWEESGLDDLWICDWPVYVDVHAAQKCKAAKDATDNHHYDICYMLVAKDTNFKISNESVGMAWVSLEKLQQYVAAGKAQQRALDMATNALQLYDSLQLRHNNQTM